MKKGRVNFGDDISRPPFSQIHNTPKSASSANFFSSINSVAFWHIVTTTHKILLPFPRSCDFKEGGKLACLPERNATRLLPPQWPLGWPPCWAPESGHHHATTAVHTLVVPPPHWGEATERKGAAQLHGACHGPTTSGNMASAIS